MSKHTIAVYGWDDFGFALARTLGSLDAETHTIKYHTKNAQIMGRLIEHGIYKKGVVEAALDGVDILHNEDGLFNDARTIYLDAPVDHVRTAVRKIKEASPQEGVTIVGTNPGIESETGLRVSEVVAQELEGVSYHYVQLGGDLDGFAVLREEPLRIGIASLDKEHSEHIKSQLSHSSLRMHVIEDIVTAEVSQALGGILALYSGVLSGIGYSTKTTVGLTCELAEILKQFAADEYGADPAHMTTQNPFWANGQWILRNTSNVDHQLGLAVAEGLDLEQAAAMFSENQRTVKSIGTLDGLYLRERTSQHEILKNLLDIFVERTADPHSVAATLES